MAPWSKVCSPGWVPDDGKLLRLYGALFRSRAKYRAGAVVKHEVVLGLFFNRNSKLWTKNFETRDLFLKKRDLNVSIQVKH